MSFRVREVSGRRGLAAFVDVPWKVVDRGRFPMWVPPLRAVVRQALDGTDPFYRRGERALFIAERGGRPVGRIAAIANHAHNAHFGDRVGFFGFFDSIDDPEVARALLERAESWLQQRGLDTARGPISPSMHHETGLLVDGFAERQVVLTPWNPPYYGGLVEAAGYAKAKDLLAYDVRLGPGFAGAGRLDRIAERARRVLSITFRDIDLGRLDVEAERVREVYNEAWRGNWGFVPVDAEAFDHLAQGLKPLLRRDFSLIAEAGEEPVGFLLIISDLNRLLPAGGSGRLWPWTLARIAWGTPRLKYGRMVLLGLKRDHRHRSLLPVVLHEAMERGRAIGAEGAEASWVLEDNDALRGLLEGLGLEPHRRWRVYERRLNPDGDR